MDYVSKIPELKPFLVNPDHMAVKTVEGRVSMREFIASMFSYHPWWLVFLFAIRRIVARILGLEKLDMPEETPVLHPDDVPLVPGNEVLLFTVRLAKEDEYWVAETPKDKHLKAYLVIVVEPLDDNLRRFHIVTVAKYMHWTGPVYFNLVRPFHYVIVYIMAREAVKPRTTP